MSVAARQTFSGPVLSGTGETPEGNLIVWLWARLDGASGFAVLNLITTYGWLRPGYKVQDTWWREPGEGCTWEKIDDLLAAARTVARVNGRTSAEHLSELITQWPEPPDE